MHKVIWRLLKETFLKWHRAQASQLAAALAFYAVLSLAPTIVIVMAITGWVFGEEAVEGKIVEQTQDWVGEQAAEFIQSVIVSASKFSAGATATLMGIATLLFGATRLFAQLHVALNQLWDVRLKPGRAVKGFLRTRLLAFVMVLGIGFFLLAFLMMSATLTAVSKLLSELLPIPAHIRLMDFLISFVIITCLFAVIYKVLPDVKIAWRDVWVGSAVTSLLLTLGRFIIGLYIGITSVGSAYGAAASAFILLIWVYYSAQAFLFGAAFTHVYTQKYGSSIVPSKRAEQIDKNIGN
jgi:membrane protein